MALIEAQEGAKTELEQHNAEVKAIIDALVAKRDELIERLDKGAVRIEDGRTKGKDVSEWEDYWIQLLRQYEQICDKLRELGHSDN